MLFLGLGLSDRVMDAKVCLFRQRLTQVSAINGLFNRFDAILRNAGSFSKAAQYQRGESGYSGRTDPTRLAGQRQTLENQY